MNECKPRFDKQAGLIIITDRRTGNEVVIDEAIFDRLLSHRQLHKHDLEAGGVLVGERREPHWYIREMSEPGYGDKRQRFKFTRSGSHHQAKICEQFELSDGMQNYAGEWHTHPESIPAPSSIDIAGWKQLKEAENVILLIVGVSGFWIGSSTRQGIITVGQLSYLDMSLN